jgi:hypothetical protein
MEQSIRAFLSGTHTKLHDEVIPADAASYSLNWLTKDGTIQLMRGRQTIGADGATGKNYGEHVGYRADGTAVRFRKVSTKIQYLNGSTWTDIITGLTAGDVTFANYQSLAGAFVYIFDPLNGIYKIATANPGSYTSLYDAAKNFKGYGVIDKGRTYLWGVAKDPTGLYGSYIDGQNTTVYTSVSGEATAGTSGTLAFKAGGAARTCFGVQITITSGGQVYTDDYNGNLTGSAGGTGTINYTTGAWTVSAGGAGTAAYQWENSNVKGVTDFTKSATRLAGEGFIVRQDAGGDAIRVVIPFDGSYFSLKANSCYQFTLDDTDLAPTNDIFRTNIGVNTLRSAIGTGSGILYLNTANPTRPQLEILKRNQLGDAFDTKPLFPHFEWNTYGYNDVAMESWDSYALIACTYDSTENNRLILADTVNETVDLTYYGVRAFAKDDGYLYGGDPVSETTYELFTGFDDNGIAIDNEWRSRGELFKTDRLKKLKHLRFKGQISPDQAVQVWLATDNDDYTLVGTILGSGDYVDYTQSYAIGTTMLGTSTLGGDDGVNVYDYFIDIKLKSGKFRKRSIKLVATGIGFVSMSMITDFDVKMFENKMPKKYRTKQNVSLDGLTTNLDTPET